MADNEVTSAGLTIQNLNDIIASLEVGFRAIYGADINIDSNSPDGQMLNLIAQAKIDVLEVVKQVYNNFDPDQAQGVVLDQRVAINNIRRQGGTYTLQSINITVDRNLTLQGLDADVNDPDGVGYTVSDDAGNQFILTDTTDLTSGTTSLTFRAKENGAVETTPNTITNPVTIILGVTAINNPTGALEVGKNQETDSQLRLRRQRSPANSSNGYLNGLQGFLFDLDGVTDCKVYENDTSITDSDGIPGHAIWAIIEGGADSEIADVIYTRKTAGCNMKGDTTYSITNPAGQIVAIKFDRPNSAELYIKFNIQPTISGQIIDTVAIADYLAENLTYTIGQTADSSDINIFAKAAIASTGASAVPLAILVSDDDISYVDYLETTTKDDKWIVDAERITITVL